MDKEVLIQYCEIFQSTPPRGRRPVATETCSFLKNFNPLRREGGDSAGWNQPVPTAISIHSAARAETVDNKDRVYDVEFQSTPPRGRRRECTDYDCRLRGNFNPLRREGGDNAS